jgi:hypothetical protein
MGFIWVKDRKEVISGFDYKKEDFSQNIMPQARNEIFER